MEKVDLLTSDALKQTGEDGTRYTYASLPPQARKVLDSKRLRYGFYRDLSDAQEREIFRRVQLGKALDKGGECCVPTLWQLEARDTRAPHGLWQKS